MILIRLLNALQGIHFIYENLMVMTAVVLIYPPVILSLLQKKQLGYLDVSIKKINKAILTFFVVSVVIFLPAFLINHFYQTILMHTAFHEGRSEVWGPFLLSQFLLVAFPEEFFFRGFLQEAFSDVLPKRMRFFGVEIGWGLVVVSLIFAFSHSLITLRAWHALIFFPGLVFGWLKEKTGTIWAGTLFHGTCNVFAYWVSLHY